MNTYFDILWIVIMCVTICIGIQLLNIMNKRYYEFPPVAEWGYGLKRLNRCIEISPDEKVRKNWIWVKRSYIILLILLGLFAISFAVYILRVNGLLSFIK